MENPLRHQTPPSPPGGPTGASASPTPPAPGSGAPFFADDEIESLQSRALGYLTAGIAIQFEGPAGMGKTTLALRVAELRGRPVSFLTGDRWMTRSDLVGREVGHTARRVEDSYIASVRRVESQSRADWRDAALTVAMAEGHTLVYDEFTRASPEANATLLSVLEEGVLVLTDPAAGRANLRAHPEFRIVLTSNPEDYVGVDSAPDALMDRIVTFRLDAVPASTEVGIVAARSGIARPEADRLVHLIRSLRDKGLPGLPVSLRTALLIARILKAQNVPVDARDARFLQICADVLCGRVAREHASDLIRQILSVAAPSARTERLPS